MVLDLGYFVLVNILVLNVYLCFPQVFWLLLDDPQVYHSSIVRFCGLIVIIVGLLCLDSLPMSRIYLPLCVSSCYWSSNAETSLKPLLILELKKGLHWGSLTTLYKRAHLLIRSVP